MKLKLPPVVIALVFALFMYLLSEILPVGYFGFFGRFYLGYFLICLGVLVGMWSILQFSLKKTTVNPFQPEKVTSLVSSGIYQYSRNPMYLAMLLVLLGWGLLLGNAFNTLVAVGFVYYMNTYQIIPEEEVLLKKFGREYKEYCTLVRRWF